MYGCKCGVVLEVTPKVSSSSPLVPNPQFTAGRKPKHLTLPAAEAYPVVLTEEMVFCTRPVTRPTTAFQFRPYRLEGRRKRW